MVEMVEHFPVLIVLLPLIAAPLCVAIRHGGSAWLLATLATWGSFAISIGLLLQVLDHGTVRYEIGNWVAPWGIEYVVDELNAYILLVITAIGSVVMPFALRSVPAEIGKRGVYLFYTMYLLCLSGLIGMTVTGDAFNVFVFLEISSLSSYTLISLGRNRKALYAAYQYLLMGTIGAIFFLIGVGLLYMMTGTLNMADLAARIDKVEDSRVIYTAFGFIVLGLGLKLAIFPLHAWLPNAYTFAPSVVSVFLAGTATKVSLYLLLRFIYTVFGHDLAFDKLLAGPLILVLAVAGIVVCSLVAVWQQNIKRILAFSSVAQIGYMLLGVSMGTVLGLQATLLHIFNHALIKAGLFLACGCILYRVGSIRIADLQGIGRRMPWTMMAFALCGLSLIGVPMTTGFISKWYLVAAALERGWWAAAVLVVLASLLALVYVGKVVQAAFFKQPAPGAVNLAEVREAPLLLLIPTWIVVVANFYFGIETDISADIAAQAAKQLMGAGR